jgi:hypothetical protein
MFIWGRGHVITMFGTTGKPRWSFVVGTTAQIAATAILFSSLPAAADSGPFNVVYMYVTNPYSIFLLLAANFVIDLFLFTLLFLSFASIWRKRVGMLDTNRDRFILRVLAGVGIITVIGQIIDGIFVSPFLLNLQILSWGVAAILIFLSIYIIANKMLKINIMVSILIGIGMVVFNLVSWSFYRSQGRFFVDPLFVLAVVPLLLGGIYLWHRTVFMAE